jgi:thiamine monophosphate kinase
VCALLTHYAPAGEEYCLMNNKNLVSYLFMAIIVATFIGMSGSAEEIIRDRALLKREKFLQLSYNSYLWSKIALTALVSILQTFLFILVGNFVMDISDGLSSELMHICKQSHVGCRIFEKQIPIDYQTAVMAEELNMNVTTCALNGGEDYELLFTVPIGDHEKIQDMDDIKMIGHITKESLGQILVTRDDQEFELKAQGWNPLT